MDDKPLDGFEELFRSALEQPPDERAAFLDAACGENLTLRREIETLLQADAEAEADSFLSDPAASLLGLLDEFDAPTDNVQGRRVGPYTVLRRLGQGGMGDVYLAVRESPFKRHVALKILRHGWASRDTFVRFVMERQILASLSHPNIARLFDGGATEDGLPYLAMEYVEGRPITAYCDDHRLPLHERIRLFRTVCEAVHYAHQNLVIHRDLKPSNILVTENGTVKLLDFGIAKLLEPEDPGSTLFQTHTGARMLTLGYAAPEQLESKAITTSTDSYSLGIILYELLVGVHPFNMDAKDLTEIEQIIRNEEPPSPSERFLRLSTEKQKKLARRRNTVPSALVKELQGDLDAIVIKALRKEPNARYSSAEQLLEDYQRGKQNLPVIARKDTLSYNTSKFMRRHKTGLFVAAGFLLMVIGFAGFYTWQITEERNKAQMEAEKAEEVTGFLLDLFESSNPYKTDGENLTAQELLDRGLERSENMKNPIVQAEMLKVIGTAYDNLGFSYKGENILDSVITKHEKLYGNQSLEMADLLVKRGIAEGLNYDIAHPYFKKAYNIYQQHNNTSPEQLANVFDQFSYTYRYKGKIDSAEFFARKSLTIRQEQHARENHERVLKAKSTLAYVLRKKGDLNEAKNLYLDVISKRENESLGQPWELGEVYNNLAFVYYDQENYGEAAEYLRKSLKINENQLGPGHSHTLQIRSNLAAMLRNINQTEQVESLYRGNIKYASEKYPENHWQLGENYGTLGYFLTQEKRYKEAEPLLRESSKIYKKDLGQQHIWTASEYSRLAANLYFQGKTTEADSLFEANYTILRNKAPNFRPLNTSQIKDLIILYDTTDNRFIRQINDYRRLIEIGKESVISE